MAMTRIMSFAAPTIPATIETIEYFDFIGKYKLQRLVFLPILRHLQDNTSLTIKPHTFVGFIGKYKPYRFSYLPLLRQHLDLDIPATSTFGPDLPYTVGLNITAA